MTSGQIINISTCLTYLLTIPEIVRTFVNYLDEHYCSFFILSRAQTYGGILKEIIFHPRHTLFILIRIVVMRQFQWVPTRNDLVENFGIYLTFTEPQRILLYVCDVLCCITESFCASLYFCVFKLLCITRILTDMFQTYFVRRFLIGVLSYERYCLGKNIL